jgi:2-haloacid dehalogenase
MIDFATKRVLTFDCYGTLIDWEAGIVATLQPILSAHGMRADAEYLLALYSELDPAVEQGPYLSYRELLTAVLRGFGERLGFSPSEPEQARFAGSVGNWPPFTSAGSDPHRFVSLRGPAVSRGTTWWPQGSRTVVF